MPVFLNFMQEFLLAFGASHQYIVYPLIVLIGLAEGPFISMICGVILSLGFLELVPVYISLMLGDLLGDVVWYEFGSRWGHRFVARFGKYFGVDEVMITKIKEIFTRYHNSVLLLSKISNGFGFAIPVLFTAGLSKIPFGRYLTINIIGQLIWSAVLLSVGYFFGNFYVRVGGWLERASFTVGAIVVAFLVYRFFIYMRARLKNMVLSDGNSDESKSR